MVTYCAEAVKAKVIITITMMTAGFIFLEMSKKKGYEIEGGVRINYNLNAGRLQEKVSTVQSRELASWVSRIPSFRHQVGAV